MLAMVACSTPPEPSLSVFQDDVMIYSHGGYDFAAKIAGGKLLVRVPCCQTYEANLAFRANLLEGIQSRIGCELAEPVFADGWIGEWQMQAELEYEDASAVPSWVV